MSDRTVVPPAVPSPRKIYLASSWRNKNQPVVLAALRDGGHEVYDFRNPAPGNSGFAWSAIDPEWLGWEPRAFAEILTSSPVAADGFHLDKEALDGCDTCVLVLPCGRSAHLELGYAAGQGKDTFVLLSDPCEPELMYLLCTGLAADLPSLLAALAEPK